MATLILPKSITHALQKSGIHYFVMLDKRKVIFSAKDPKTQDHINFLVDFFGLFLILNKVSVSILNSL